MVLISRMFRMFMDFQELCRISAIFIHLFWMNGHSWVLVMLCHLYRRMTDVRDVNHGNMQFYYIIGYGTSECLFVVVVKCLCFLFFQLFLV